MEPHKEPSLGNKRRSWEEMIFAGLSVDVEPGGEEPDGASNQEVDSDDQTNAQVSEILRSTL